MSFWISLCIYAKWPCCRNSLLWLLLSCVPRDTVICIHYMTSRFLLHCPLLKLAFHASRPGVIMTSNFFKKALFLMKRLIYKLVYQLKVKTVPNKDVYVKHLISL